MLKHVALAAATVLGLSLAQGGNLLVNPSFEDNPGNVIPAGWTYFMPPNGTLGSYWDDSAYNNAHSGNLYWKQWGVYWDAARTNVAGIYQQFNSAPNSTYQASGWFFTKNDAQQNDQMAQDNKAWLEVSFRDAGGHVLSLYKSDDFTTDVGVSTWFNFPVTNVCDLSQQTPSGDTNSAYMYYAVTGSVSQLVAPAGTAFVRYQFAMVQAGNGGGSVYFDDAVLDQLSGPVPPTITSLSPPNPSMFVSPGDGLSFTASSPSGTTINNSRIHMVLNGTDVSSSLNISGSESNKTVSYSGLLSNTAYTASIAITDAFNFTASATTYFETTWVGIQPIVYSWEAEDFDYTNGMYINNPDLCGTPDNPNCYFGKVGVQGVDENEIQSPGDGDHIYRPNDPMGTTGAGDLLRKPFVTAGVLDYKVGWFEGGEWVNYTRDWPAGTYWVIARLANGGGSGTLTLSQVSATATNDLGTFNVKNGRGWTTYDFYYLQDTNGNFASVTLNGKATLRATTGGNADMGFFALVKAELDIPILGSLYPNGTQPFQNTNSLAFTVASAGTAIPNSNIGVVLDGIDVSSKLTISGSSSSKTALYPLLLPNAMHKVILNITNASGAGISVSKDFDTFTENNYMVEAEDFNFDSGQFIDNPTPNAYGQKGATIGIDYSHAETDGEQFAYRLGLPTEIAQDYLRQAFVASGAVDYHVGWFNADEWGNYTRTYPAGKFLVYGRFAGSGNYTMRLDEVVSGVTTSNQVTKALGVWNGFGRDWQIHDWVMLTQGGAPAIVTLSGLTTLRITSGGNCNPSYIMLVPVSGINASAAKSGANVVISFPTQDGVVYRVFYRSDLTSGDWTLFTSVLGDGTVKSATDTPTSAARYYKVAAP